MFKIFSSLSFMDSIDHKTNDWSIDNPYSFRQWYHEDVSNKPNLLVVVGDSWSWGDHLGKIDWDNYVDDPVRLTQIYGRHLSNKLNADWVNLTKPGASNYWMYSKLRKLLPDLQRVRAEYENIFVIVTLTEDLRETWYPNEYECLKGDFGIDILKTYTDAFIESESLIDFLTKIQEFLFKNFEDLLGQIPNASCLMSRAFTDNLVESPNLLNKTWCDVFQDDVNYSDYQKPVMFLGEMAVEPLITKIFPNKPKDEKLHFKQEFVDLMDLVASRWNFLAFSKYNMFGSTNHPTPDGHYLWADYLYQQFTK